MATSDWDAGDGYVAPKLDEESFNCPNCRAYSHQVWGRLSFSLPGRVISIEPEVKNVNDTVWRAAKCQRCYDSSIWFSDRLLWPQIGLGVKPHPDMPEGVKGVFVEATQVAVISRRAGAALARATLEQLIKGLHTGDKGTLNERIGRLEGRVSTGLYQMLDVVRYTGNEVLHESEAGELVAIALDDEVGPALIETFLECTNRLVDELITRPAQDRQLWEKLPPSVMESIRRRSERIS